MSKYVISDLHGEYDKFLKMLELIDCGACFTKDKRCSLVCLRLDDILLL